MHPTFVLIYKNDILLQGEQSVGLEFCLVYSLVSSSSLCILPWSLFLLSWHLYLAGVRNGEQIIFPFRLFCQVKEEERELSEPLNIFIS